MKLFLSIYIVIAILIQNLTNAQYEDIDETTLYEDIYETTYSEEPIEPSTPRSVDPDLLREALALRQDILWNVNSEISRSVKTLTDYSVKLHEQFAFLYKSLNKKRDLVSDLDRQVRKCAANKSSANQTLCDSLLMRTFGGNFEEAIEVKWRVCKYNYVDQYDINATAVQHTIESKKNYFEDMLEPINACGDDECLRQRIYQLVEHRTSVLNEITSLTSEFLNDKNILNKVYDCVFDGSLTFLNEVKSTVQVYCDCAKVAEYGRQ